MPRSSSRIAVLALLVFACSGKHSSHLHEAAGEAGAAPRPDAGAQGAVDMRGILALAGRPASGASGAAVSGVAGTGSQPMAAADSASDADAGVMRAERTTAQSGSRLKVVYLDAGGGARNPALFFDTQENVRCSFRPPGDAAGDESMERCLPADVQTVYYADAACSVAVVRREACAYAFHAGPFVSVSGTAGVEVFEVGATQMASALYSKTTDGGCMQWSYSGPVQLMAAKVPPERFVSGRVQKLPVPGLADLTLRTVDGADGSRFSTGLEYKGELCKPYSLADEVYCVPDRVANASGRDFESADCTGPRLASWAAPKGDPLFIHEWMTDLATGCERVTGYFELGAEVMRHSSTFQTAYIERMCLTASSGNYRFFHVGAPIPEARFPRLKAVEIGNGRMRKTQYQGPDGSVLGWAYGWRDTQLGMSCTVEGGADTVELLLCRPSEVNNMRSVYSDAKCTSELGEYETCTPLDAVRYAKEYRKSMLCPGLSKVTVYPVTKYTGPVYRSDGGANPSKCELLDRPITSFYRLGEALSTGELAALEYKE